MSFKKTLPFIRGVYFINFYIDHNLMPKIKVLPNITNRQADNMHIISNITGGKANKCLYVTFL